MCIGFNFHTAYSIFMTEFCCIVKKWIKSITNILSFFWNVPKMLILPHPLILTLRRFQDFIDIGAIRSNVLLNVLKEKRQTCWLHVKCDDFCYFTGVFLGKILYFTTYLPGKVILLKYTHMLLKANIFQKRRWKMLGTTELTQSKLKSAAYRLRN